MVTLLEGSTRVQVEVQPSQQLIIIKNSTAPGPAESDDVTYGQGAVADKGCQRRNCIECTAPSRLGIAAPHLLADNTYASLSHVLLPHLHVEYTGMTADVLLPSQAATLATTSCDRSSQGGGGEHGGGGGGAGDGAAAADDDVCDDGDEEGVTAETDAGAAAEGTSWLLEAKPAVSDPIAVRYVQLLL